MGNEDGPRVESDRTGRRQGGVGRHDNLSGGEAHVLLQAAARSFLRVRPLVVAPTAVVNGALLFSSGAPAGERAVVGGAFASLVVAFFAERWVLSRRDVSWSWLSASLGATVVAISVGLAFTGGLASPLLSLWLAPSITAVAAFGWRRDVAWVVGPGVVAVGVLGLVPAATRFPPPPPPWAGLMGLTSLAATAVLLGFSVTGVAGAHRRALRALDALRSHAIAEARGRARHVELTSARIGHELKNPLAAVKGLVALEAEAAATDARRARRYEVMLAEIERIESTLREHLTTLKPLEELRLVTVDLRGLVEDLAVSLEGRAAASRARIVRAGTATIEADPQRLREALLNLATNAIEAMPGGGELRIEIERGDDDGAVIRVRDEGTGFDPASAATGASEKPGGSGLGLSIARAAVELHGGEMRIASSAVGTEVAVRLPPAPPARTLAKGGANR